MQCICRYIVVAVLAVGSGLAVAPAAAQHVDILVQARDGRLLTGLFELENNHREDDVGVFPVRWTADGAGLVFAQEPGFSALGDRGLPPGSLVGFDLLGPLEYWNGQDAIAFAAPPEGEALEISVGPQDVVVDGASAPRPGFNFAQINSSGTLHRHPTYSLLAHDGNADVGDGIAPASGVYVAELALRSSDAGVVPSSPFWLVFDYGSAGTAHHAALEWIDDYRVRRLSPGDADGDGRVDLADFGPLKQHFGQEGRRSEGDFNGDRRVDLADFGLLKQNFGAGGQVAAVPEPSAAALALLGLLALMCPGRRRRRGVSCGRGLVRFPFFT